MKNNGSKNLLRFSYLKMEDEEDDCLTSRVPSFSYLWLSDCGCMDFGRRNVLFVRMLCRIFEMKN